MSSKKTEGKYVCEPCDFKTCDLKDFKRHLETRKHNDNAMITKKPNEHICECGHEYKYASGLSRHRKVCSSVTTLVVVPPKANSGAGADPVYYELYDIDVDIDIDSDNDSISTAIGTYSNVLTESQLGSIEAVNRIQAAELSPGSSSNDHSTESLRRFLVSWSTINGCRKTRLLLRLFQRLIGLNPVLFGFGQLFIKPAFFQ